MLVFLAVCLVETLDFSISGNVGSGCLAGPAGGELHFQVQFGGLRVRVGSARRGIKEPSGEILKSWAKTTRTFSGGAVLDRTAIQPVYTCKIHQIEILDL